MEVFVSIIALIFGVLQIILFFKVWGMTNDVAAIRNLLARDLQRNYSSSQEPSTQSSSSNNDEVKKSGRFYVEQRVVLLEDESQMRIKEITEDGKFACYINSGSKYKGTYSSTEIEDFDLYWKRKKGLL